MKSTMPRLPVDVCSPSFGASRDRSHEIIATKQGKFGGGFEQDIDDESEQDRENKEGKCQLEALGRRVKDVEKEARLQNSFPPVGGPIKVGGPIYIWRLPMLYGGRFLENKVFQFDPLFV
ncbi:hypothetical protein Tco_0776872 [Tanacetum coccineum]